MATMEKILSRMTNRSRMTRTTLKELEKARPKSTGSRFQKFRMFQRSLEQHKSLTERSWLIICSSSSIAKER
jgi:hypothetical protein